MVWHKTSVDIQTLFFISAWLYFFISTQIAQVAWPIWMPLGGQIGQCGQQKKREIEVRFLLTSSDLMAKIFLCVIRLDVSMRGDIYSMTIDSIDMWGGVLTYLPLKMSIGSLVFYEFRCWENQPLKKSKELEMKSFNP